MDLEVAEALLREGFPKQEIVNLLALSVGVEAAEQTVMEAANRSCPDLSLNVKRSFGHFLLAPWMDYPAWPTE